MMPRRARLATAVRHGVASLAVAAMLPGCTAPAELSASQPAPSPHQPAMPELDDDSGRDAAAAAPSSAPGLGGAAAGIETVRRFRSVRGHAETPAPFSVRVPAIGVDSNLTNLGRQPDGSVEVPADWQRAGWFTGSARPGQTGPAVILGHVDSRAGPAVFHRLHELAPGDEILVDRADGSTVRFTVDRIERHEKDDFPTQAVYYPTLEATLRLVTCGGVFERTAGSYRDNVIVFATQTS